MEFSRDKQGSLTRFIIDKFNFIVHKSQLTLSSCDLCGGNCSHYVLLCSHCARDLPLFNHQYTQGDLLNWPAINQALPKNQFDHLVCLAPHIWPFNQWISQFKYQGRFELASLFAHQLHDHWQTLTKIHELAEPQAIMSVPLHGQKWQSRGYNQAHFIAKHFAKRVAIPYLDTALVRIKKTTSQVGKTGNERRKNLKNAFAINADNREIAEHILLIDDVITTGSTANEICRLLKKHGTKTVTLMTVSLSLPK
ncbi:MAG: ComF family protein [Alteromonadaceae bacterium]|nr:ComF family protein [Alteromonadaceae bacterium]